MAKIARKIRKLREGIRTEREIIRGRLREYGSGIVDEQVREKIKKETEELNKEFRKNMVTALTAAFALVIALQWKDVIAEGVNYLTALSRLPQGQAFGFKVVSAIAVTFVSVLGILITTRLLKKKKLENEKSEKAIVNKAGKK